MSFINNCLQKMWIYFLNLKSQVFNTFLKFKQMVELESGRKVKVLCSMEEGNMCQKPSMNTALHMGYNSNLHALTLHNKMELPSIVIDSY